MNIFFNDNFNFKNITGNTKTESGEKSALSGKITNLPEYIAALKEGSMFKGEIIDIRNNAVKILLGGNDILNATAKNPSNMNIGDILNFKVESNTGIQLLVKAVSAGNTGENNWLMKALDSAEVPVNERNISLVKELMANGQAIDKNTIKTLVSNLNSFSELDVESAVSMYKHEIPINAENVAQFNAYTEGNNRLIENFNDMTKDISGLFKDYVSSNGTEGLKEFVTTVLNILDSTGELSNAWINSVIEDNTAVNNTPAHMNQQTGVTGGEAQFEADIATDTSPQSPGSSQTLPDLSETAADATDLKNTKITINDSVINSNTLNEKDSINGRDILSLIDNEKLEGKLEKVIKDKFLIKGELLNKTDEEIKSELEKYYKELETTTNKLIKALETNNMEKSGLYNTAKDIKSNINFMSDMSHMAMYIQIPVKLSANDTHTELYVFNQHRNKNREKDVLTAFLHLDMEHLGATDVSIRLEKGNLTTKFMLKDSVSAHIVEEHLGELKKRLDEKGYTTTVLVEDVADKNAEADEETTPFQQVLMLDKPEKFIRRYTFDVRA